MQISNQPHHTENIHTTQIYRISREYKRIFEEEERNECTNTVGSFRETLVFPVGDTPTWATHLSTGVAVPMRSVAGRWGWSRKVKGRETRGVRNCRGWKSQANLQHGRHRGFPASFPSRQRDASRRERISYTRRSFPFASFMQTRLRIDARGW